VSGVYSHIIFLILITLNIRLISVRIRSGLTHSIVLTSMSSAVYLVALWIPAQLQVRNVTDSKLVKFGFLGSPSKEELTILTWHWVLEITLITATEWIFWKITSMRNVSPPNMKYLGDIRLTLFLIISGSIFFLVLPPPTLESRGLPGQGIPILLRTFLITGTALSIYFWFHKSRVVLALTVISILILISGNVRSPLLVIGAAYVARWLPKLREIRLKSILFSITLAILFSFTASTMSSMRANIERNQGFYASEIISTNLRNPILGIYGAGLDTLDGYRFSREIADREQGRPLDLLNIVLTFVPRQIWETKPTDFSVDMSAKYLGYRVSGQFLSPVGYLTLIFDSYLSGLLALAIFILIYCLLSKRYFATFWNAILLTVAIRFLIGGSSFDIYYGLTVVLPILVFSFLSKFIIRKSSN